MGGCRRLLKRPSHAYPTNKTVCDDADMTAGHQVLAAAPAGGARRRGPSGTRSAGEGRGALHGAALFHDPLPGVQSGRQEWPAGHGPSRPQKTGPLTRCLIGPRANRVLALCQEWPTTRCQEWPAGHRSAFWASYPALTTLCPDGPLGPVAASTLPPLSYTLNGKKKILPARLPETPSGPLPCV
jgi:hypothetical protein